MSDVKEMLPDWMGDPATKVDGHGIHVLTLTGRCSCGNWRYIVAPDWKVPAEHGGGYMTDECHECLGTMEFDEAWEHVDGLVSSYDELRPKQKIVTDGGVDRPSDEEQQTDPFDANIYNLELGDQMPNFDETECTPEVHEGRPAFIFAIGPHDEDVRKAQVCTECGMVAEETRFDDVVGITLEAVGGVRDRVHNYPGEQSLSKVPLSDVLELAGIGDDADVTHVGVTDGELMIQTTEADDAE